MWRQVGLAGVTVLMAGAVAMPSASASASASAGDCDRVVVDGANVLGAGTAVARAAQALKVDGAVVRVRTYRSVARGDLDAALRAEVRRCSSWHGSGSARRPALLVVAVDVGDRKTAISYGSRWSATLDPAQQTVQTETINPALKRKAYGDAIVAGLRRLDDLVTRKEATASSSDPGSDVPLDENGQPLTADPFVPPEVANDGVGVVVAVGILGLVLAFVAALARGGRSGGSSWGSPSRRWRNGTTTTGFIGSDSSFGGGTSGGMSGGMSGGASGGASDGGGGSSTSW
jgi:uncharacterized membrane protein YgcG